MGESGSRRSTLVSRLPIFRRSSSKRQDSLPSSPSSGGVGNGNVHTSSPSSTNSSSGSTQGKRRSLFRAPSLGFSSKRNNDPSRDQPANLNLSPPPPPQETDANGNNQSGIPTSVSAAFSEGGGRSKSRHSFGFGSHRHKKITRSQTEDFDKASSSSSSTGNRNVFINCISGSGVNEGDDSGFLDDFSGASNNNKRSSSRQKKQLLPKSFSAHHRFSNRTSDHHRPPEVTVEACVDAPASSATVTPGSWPGDLLGPGGESSLQSPMISEDRTTAITPSEFHPITEDSVSDCVDALPAPSPVPAVPPPSATVPEKDDAGSLEAAGGAENPITATSTSQVFSSPPPSSADRPLPPDTTDYETAVSLSEPETAVPCPPLSQQSAEERREREEERRGAREEVTAEERRELSRARRVGYNTETSESEPCVVRSEGAQSNPEQERPERRTRTTRSFQEPRGSFCGCHEPRHSHLRKPHAGSLCSSVSPYHEVMRLERRLRSSSEGAGGPHIHGNVPGLEGCGLLKHRHNSSSSKLGSLDVLNNLGSSELDEDDLMLDLDLSDADHRHRHVSRENSSQSLTSCLLHSPLDPTGERILGKDLSHRESSRPTSLLPAEGGSGLASGREEETLAPGMETVPLRLMQQDCTAVKTLLLRLKRTLQESAETSPASSLQSLPISPCSEKSLPFKDPGREEALLLQLKEKDELILKLQTELESAKAALKMKDCQMTDRTTQTEHVAPETSHPGRWSGAGSSNSSSSSSLGPRERRVVRATAGAAHAGDHINQHAPHHPLHGHGRAHTAREERYHHQAASAKGNPIATSPVSNLYASNHTRHLEAVSSSTESLTQSAGGSRRGDHHPHTPAASHIPRAINFNGSSASSSASVHSLGRASVSSSDRSPPPPSSASSVSSNSSTFTGRLGQPPRGPLSLHSYSRKNVFLQHSLHTAELQALTQRDS